jgi:hypothetical protein
MRLTRSGLSTTDWKFTGEEPSPSALVGVVGTVQRVLCDVLYLFVLCFAAYSESLLSPSLHLAPCH